MWRFDLIEKTQTVPFSTGAEITSSKKIFEIYRDAESPALRLYLDHFTSFLPEWREFQNEWQAFQKWQENIKMLEGMDEKPGQIMEIPVDGEGFLEVGGPLVPPEESEIDMPSGNHSDLENVNIPERANREGDSQGLPTVNDGKFIQDLVIEDINERIQVGIKRYGTGLQAFNGRKSLLDAYEETMDLLMYLKQRLVEEDELYSIILDVWLSDGTKVGLPIDLWTRILTVVDSVRSEKNG
jgi:hypothetical protein